MLAGNSGILTLTQYCQLPESLRQASPPFGQLCLPSLHVYIHLLIYLEDHFMCKSSRTRRATKEATAYYSAATDK